MFVMEMQSFLIWELINSFGISNCINIFCNGNGLIHFGMKMVIINKKGLSRMGKKMGTGLNGMKMETKFSLFIIMERKNLRKLIRMIKRMDYQLFGTIMD